MALEGALRPRSLVPPRERRRPIVRLIYATGSAPSIPVCSAAASVRSLGFPWAERTRCPQMPRPCRWAITTYASWTAGGSCVLAFRRDRRRAPSPRPATWLVAGGAAAVSPRREPGGRGEGSQWGAGGRRDDGRPKKRLGDSGAPRPDRGARPGHRAGAPPPRPVTRSGGKSAGSCGWCTWTWSTRPWSRVR